MNSKYGDEEREVKEDISQTKSVKACVSSNPTSETDSAIRGRLRKRTAVNLALGYMPWTVHMVYTCTVSTLTHRNGFRSVRYRKCYMIYARVFPASDSAEIEIFMISHFWTRESSTRPNESRWVCLRDKVWVRVLLSICSQHEATYLYNWCFVFLGFFFPPLLRRMYCTVQFHWSPKSAATVGNEEIYAHE